MNKAQLVKRISFKNDLSQKEVKKYMTFIFEEIKEIVCEGQEIKIVGFGTFTHKRTKRRNGTDPNTLEPRVVESRALPKFRPAGLFKKMVADRLGDGGKICKTDQNEYGTSKED